MERWMNPDGTGELYMDPCHVDPQQLLANLVTSAQDMRRRMRFPDDHVIIVKFPHGPLHSAGMSIEAELNKANIAIEMYEEEK